MCLSGLLAVKRYVLPHRVLVHFEFRGVVEVQIKQFNHQNALWGLYITDIRSCQLENIRYQVAFAPSWGVDSSWQCHEIEVLSVTPCDEDGVANEV